MPNQISIKEDNSEAILKEIENAKARALEKIGLVAEGYAKRLCPVDTGRLRNSITHTRDSDYAYIGTNVEYAPYVEMGTSKRKPKPYLRPAAEDHIDEYKDILEEEMNK